MPTRKTKQEKNAEMVVDQVGEVDGDVEAMPEIELSSDEEDEEDDCALIVLKRPPVTERTIEEVEVSNLVSFLETLCSHDLDILGHGGWRHHHVWRGNWIY